jgi:hypothetical protein
VCVYVCVAEQPNSGLGPSIFEVSTPNTIRHTHTHTPRDDSSERAISSSNWPLPTYHTASKKERTSIPQQDSNPSFQQSSGRRPTPYTARPPGWATLCEYYNLTFVRMHVLTTQLFGYFKSHTKYLKRYIT